jgi:transposase
MIPTKRKPPKNKNRPLPVQQVKVEEDTDTKSLLQLSPESSKLPKGQKISQEQINQLIHYIVNDNMSITKASQKVNISQCSGNRYYNIYKNDPEKKIPVPQNQLLHLRKNCTQEQIGNLIKYIVDDKMTIAEASAKANLNDSSGRSYYAKYLKDPNHTIPIPQLRQCYTQDQRSEFIDYIINDKMNITAASKKARIIVGTAQYYYHKYFKEQNPDIATPNHIATPRCYTQEQIKEVISYVVDDKMSIAAASRKVSFNEDSARKYYRQYLNANNMEIPVTKKTYTQDERNQFIGYIVDDKMTIRAASKKANMCEATGRKYYHQYRKDHHFDYPILKRVTQDRIDEFIGYIVNNKMSITAASKKVVNMSSTTGHRYYRKYLKNKIRDEPT